MSRVYTDDFVGMVMKQRDDAFLSKDKQQIIKYIKEHCDLPTTTLEPVFWLAIKKSVEAVKGFPNKAELISYYQQKFEDSQKETCSRCKNSEFSYMAKFCRICGLERGK